MDGVFSVLGLRGGGSGGWSIFRFCGFGEGERWVKYFQMLWLQGVMGRVFSDFVASGRGEWWV